MISSVALAVCLVLAALAVFQLLLISGAPLGRFAWGGQHTVLPARLRVGSAVSVLLYGLFALIVLERAGLSALFTDERVGRIGTWVLVGYLSLGVLMNAVSRSKPERYLMTPVALLLAGLCLLVARA